MGDTITTAQAAKLCGCSRQAILQRIARGTLKAYRDVYGNWHIDPAAALTLKKAGRKPKNREA